MVVQTPEFSFKAIFFEGEEPVYVTSFLYELQMDLLQTAFCDSNSVLRLMEFSDEEGARSALSLAGTILDKYLVRVPPSKTAIAPINPTFLPQVTHLDVKLFFETICGEVIFGLCEILITFFSLDLKS